MKAGALLLCSGCIELGPERPRVVRGTPRECLRCDECGHVFGIVEQVYAVTPDDAPSDMWADRYIVVNKGRDPMQPWFLSFAREGEWLGSAIVLATSEGEATRVSRYFDCDWDGEVIAAQVPNKEHLPDEYLNRRLTADDLREMRKAIEAKRRDGDGE